MHESHARAPLSPRRRRLRRTAGVLFLALAAGSIVATVWYQRSRPVQYHPDEPSDAITRSLAQALPPGAPRPRFTDVTAAAGLSGFRTFQGERTSQLPEDMGGGAAWGDFDNDGHEDLLLVSAGGPLGVPTNQLTACALYRNRGDGSFSAVAEFPRLHIRGMGAAWGDYDSDGFLDVAITGFNTLLLLHNEGGTGRFNRDARIPDLAGFWSGASWGDYDNDRRLDLYVCGYVQYVENEADRQRVSQQISTAVPYTLNPASYPPGTNLLFHQNADGSFTDLASALGVQNPTGRSLGALWHDFDDDGWLDLYVANDISDNVFYHNLGGRFEDISHPAWVADYRSAMGLAAGDHDRDGDDDLFIGHWVAQENALYDNLHVDFNLRPERRATNAAPPRPQNTVTGTNSASPTNATKHYALRFMDIADQRGLGQIALPFVSWGCEFIDFDADGWLDLIVANGSTLEQSGPPPKRLKPEEPFLFWNQRGQFFHNLAPLCAPLSEKHVARGLAAADYDDDGDVDVAVVDLAGGVQLLRNEMQTGHWLEVRLQSRNARGALAGFGDGAKVIVQVGPTRMRRTVSSVSYLSQSSRTLHFGLGDVTQVDRLEVRWLGGATNFYDGLAANSTWLIAEGEPVARRSMPRGAAKTVAAAQSNPAPSPAHDERARLLEFWTQQRAAMNAMKIENDPAKASRLFRAALAINPQHEDSRYYLGNCLAMQGDWGGALEQLAELTRINPQSHRGHAQWGTLRALSAKTPAELAAAVKSLERAQALNPEETGVLLVLGEVALLRHETLQADQHLAHACRTNPKAVGGFFLRGYLAAQRGDTDAAREFLQRTRDALGPDWQPKGATSEGDVHRRQYVEKTPLSRFWEQWNGSLEPTQAYASLTAFLERPEAMNPSAR